MNTFQTPNASKYISVNMLDKDLGVKSCKHMPQIQSSVYMFANIIANTDVYNMDLHLIIRTLHKVIPHPHKHVF